MTIHCSADFNYVRSPASVAVTCDVLDGRMAKLPDYEECGFTFEHHPSEVVDWRDEAELNRVHGPEVEQLAMEFLGCDIAVAYPALVRSPQVAEQIEDYAPIELVHSDFTDDYRPMTYEPHRPYAEFIQPLLAERGLAQSDIEHASRQTLLQFWRNTGPVVADYPLAVCDASSVDPSRRVTSIVENYGGRRLEFELSIFEAPDDTTADRWYTFPAMTRDEVLAFRTYDSRCVDEGRPYWTPHSAFRDPFVEATPETRRESVEMRVLCLWR